MPYHRIRNFCKLFVFTTTAIARIIRRNGFHQTSAGFFADLSKHYASVPEKGGDGENSSPIEVVKYWAGKKVKKNENALNSSNRPQFLLSEESRSFL